MHQISNDFWDQVELNAVNVEKYLDNQGWLTRDDFVKVAQDHKLLELERKGATAVTGSNETLDNKLILTSCFESHQTSWKSSEKKCIQRKTTEHKSWKAAITSPDKLESRLLLPPSGSEIIKLR